MGFFFFNDRMEILKWELFGLHNDVSINSSYGSEPQQHVMYQSHVYNVFTNPVYVNRKPIKAFITPCDLVDREHAGLNHFHEDEEIRHIYISISLRD